MVALLRTDSANRWLAQVREDPHRGQRCAPTTEEVQNEIGGATEAAQADITRKKGVGTICSGIQAPKITPRYGASGKGYHRSGRFDSDELPEPGTTHRVLSDLQSRIRSINICALDTPKFERAYVDYGRK